ncbi:MULTISPECIES: PDDEXK-like family protein [unclassified Flavobacterium]|uniref:PDDEXK-like family protein n=1 Tax=Flavobacterium sp. RSP15 TaxID=2497485 RepID=UPI000F83D768|nr:PD-(D/E)XK nuclease family protein [Flavobacterium sp. RSP15]RTY86919.1 hypothetical protein EKM00_08690 [Flavobacterium sp. RSP15]
MNTEKAKNLLSQVSGLLKSYEKLAKSTGENFNIFSVMGMESDEVKTHSRIIAELLNPKGSHSQGSVFLKYFFEEIEELKSIENFDFDNAKVIVEEHIGIINRDYTVGGYIDIVIKDERNKIEVVIENKIYATDQKGQLLRYKNHYKNCKLIYLTLDGKKPSKESYCHLDEQININIEDIILICYKDKILSWIDKCHTEAIQQPMLREMLKQYSNLLKKLTHQTINNELKMEISDLIKNNFLEASQIANNFEKVKTQIITEFWEKVKVSCKNNLGNEWHIEIKPDLINRFNHILFHQSGNDRAFFYCRYNKNNGEVIYGILLNSEMQNQIKCKDIFDNLDKTLILPRYNYGDQSVIWFKDQNFNFSDLDLLSKINLKKDELAEEFAGKITSIIETNKELYAKILEHINQQNK